MNKPELSIVIVNFNSKEYIRQCLEAVFRDPKSDQWQLIVIDNASVDGSQEFIREQFPSVHLVESKENMGFPSANNLGFKRAEADYIFMLNPDAIISKGSITVLLDYIRSHKKVGLCAPKLLNADGSLQLSAWQFPKLHHILAEMLYLNRLIPSRYYLNADRNQPLEVDSVSGAAMLFSKNTIHELGGLDENLFWIEDVDLCYRIRESGNIIMYLPNVHVMHYIGGSARKDYTISLSNQVFNKIKFFKKHYTFFPTLILMILSFCDSFFRMLIFALLSPLNKQYGFKACAYAYTFPKVFNPPSGIRK